MRGQSMFSRLRKRFELVPGQYRQHYLRNGVITAIILAFIFYCGFSRSIPFVSSSGEVVHARFTHLVRDLRDGSPVREYGVDVGQIQSIKRDPSGRGVDVTMKLTSGSYEPVHQDATAHIWWRDLLGYSMYVGIDPGSASAPLLADQTIPESQTTEQVQFDQVLHSLQANARSGLRTTFKTLHGGLGDSGAIHSTIDNVKPAFDNLTPALTGVQGTQPFYDIPRLESTGSKTLAALSRSEDQLAGLIDNGDTTLGVTAARRSELASTVQSAPAALAQTRATTARLITTLDKLDPVASALQPGAAEVSPTISGVRPALDQLRKLTPQAIPTLRDLRPTLASLQRAARSGVPLVNGLNPSLTRTNQKIVPFLNQVDPQTELRNYEAIGPLFSDVASAASSYDVHGHWVNFAPLESLSGLSSLEPCNVDLFDSAHPDETIGPVNSQAKYSALCKVLNTALGSLLTGQSGKLRAHSPMSNKLVNLLHHPKAASKATGGKK